MSGKCTDGSIGGEDEVGDTDVGLSPVGVRASGGSRAQGPKQPRGWLLAEGGGGGTGRAHVLFLVNRPASMILEVSVDVGQECVEHLAPREPPVHGAGKRCRGADGDSEKHHGDHDSSARHLNLDLAIASFCTVCRA